MQRPVLAALLLLWSSGFAFAQGDTKPPAVQQDPEAAYQQLARDFQKAIADWRTAATEAAKKAKEEGGKVPAASMVPPTKEFIDRARELADQYAGKDDAVRFLAFICKNVSNERNALKKAVGTLLTDHAASPAIGLVLDHLQSAVYMGAKGDAMALLDEVVGKHRDVDVVAHALIVRGNLRLQQAQSEGERKAAEQDLRKVATVTKNEDLLKQAKDSLFEIENLQIGCAAPEIVGVDTEGAPFKLADHRGKVVLLDFWGFW